MKTIEQAQACIKWLTGIKHEYPELVEGIETVQECLICVIVDRGNELAEEREK